MGNVWVIFKVAYLSLVAFIEVLFVSSPMRFGRLHDDIIFWHKAIISEVIKEIVIANSTHPY